MSMYRIAASALLLVTFSIAASAQEVGRYQLMTMPDETGKAQNKVILLDTTNGQTWHYTEVKRHKGSLAIDRRKVWRPVNYLEQSEDGTLLLRPLPPGVKASQRKASRRGGSSIPVKAGVTKLREAKALPSSRSVRSTMMPASFKPGAITRINGSALDDSN